jgi:hypothetical protein
MWRVTCDDENVKGEEIEKKEWCGKDEWVGVLEKE